MNELLNGIKNILPHAKAISATITLILFVATAVLIMKSRVLASYTTRIKNTLRGTPHAKKRVLKAWVAVLDYLNEESVHAWKLAIIQADILLDEALRIAGLPGKNTGERLKAANRAIIPNIDDVWMAHKLRNSIAHETDFLIDRVTAETAIKTYEKTLKHFGLID